VASDEVCKDLKARKRREDAGEARTPLINEGDWCDQCASSSALRSCVVSSSPTSAYRKSLMSIFVVVVFLWLVVSLSGDLGGHRPWSLSDWEREVERHGRKTCAK
jgi:hypothetical protein